MMVFVDLSDNFVMGGADNVLQVPVPVLVDVEDSVIEMALGGGRYYFFFDPPATITCRGGQFSRGCSAGAMPAGQCIPGFCWSKFPRAVICWAQY